MFKGISLLKKKRSFQKKENGASQFLFSSLLLIPLLLVILSSFLMQSIKGELFSTHFLSHLSSGIFGYFLAFFISYVPLDRIRKYSIPFYLFSIVSLLMIYFFGITVYGAQR